MLALATLFAPTGEAFASFINFVRIFASNFVI